MESDTKIALQELAQLTPSQRNERLTLHLERSIDLVRNVTKKPTDWQYRAAVVSLNKLTGLVFKEGSIKRVLSLYVKARAVLTTVNPEQPLAADIQLELINALSDYLLGLPPPLYDEDVDLALYYELLESQARKANMVYKGSN